MSFANRVAQLSRNLQTHARPITYSASFRKGSPFYLNARNIPDDREHESTHMLRMVMFGKPGAGKGTLTARLVKKYDIVSLSTGDLLRQHIAERTEIGKLAEDLVARGALLPDELVLKVVTSELDRLQNKHWILDGFPRTLGQGELLDAHLRAKSTPLSLVVNVDVPDKIILSRISDRWVHLSSGRVYNMSYNPPKVEGMDDETGEPLTKRPDDNPEVFARRLAQFYTSTSPLLAYYTKAAASSVPPQNSYQHPHQVAFHRPAPRLRIRILTGITSDENWPILDGLVRMSFPTLAERVDAKERRRWHYDFDDTAKGNMNATSCPRLP